MFIMLFINMDFFNYVECDWSRHVFPLKNKIVSFMLIKHSNRNLFRQQALSLLHEVYACMVYIIDLFLMSSMRLKKGKCKCNLTSVDVDVHVSIITCMKKYFRQRKQWCLFSRWQFHCCSYLHSIYMVIIL